MKTEIVVMEGTDQDIKIIERAGNILKQGGLVAFPTETVYGLGGDALNKESSRKIYSAKGRPSDNPLIVHIADMEMLGAIVEKIPETAKKLAEKYWPGPLTMILNKSAKVPYETTGGLETVAVRMPKHPVALSLIRAAGGYVAAPSANTSGRPSPTMACFVKEDMDGRIDMILDGGMVGIGLESTIIDLTEEVPMILRPGYITKEMLEDILKMPVALDKTILGEDILQAPKAPGMKYRHYAPQGALTIVTGEEKKVVALINEHTEEMRKKGEKVGVIGTEETASLYTADSVKSAGSRKDEEAVARELYRILREFDDEKVTVIYSEAFDDTGLGQAIMNRLLKAAGHHIEYVNEK